MSVLTLVVPTLISRWALPPLLRLLQTLLAQVLKVALLLDLERQGQLLLLCLLLPQSPV